MPDSETLKPSVHASPIRRRVVDMFIAILLLVFALDTMPCTPLVVRQYLNPVLNVTGLWQGTWNLFAPVPDHQNHRLHADIVYTDGRVVEWNSPDWRKQSPWQRFTGHRESEFIENIWLDANSAAWRDFAKYLQQHEGLPVEIPDRVVLSVFTGEVPDPDQTPWPSVTSPRTLDQKRVFFTLRYE